MDAIESETVREIVHLLATARTKAVELSVNYANSLDWDGADRWMRWGRSVDAIRREMEGTNGGNGHVPPLKPLPDVGAGIKLPYFYADNGRLIMRGPSRDGGFYEQRVLKAHYDLIVQKLSEKAGRSCDFLMQDLIDRREMPVFEPGLIVKLLAQKGLLQMTQRGRYGFVKGETFASDAARIWSELPRG